MMILNKPSDNKLTIAGNMLIFSKKFCESYGIDKNSKCSFISDHGTDTYICFDPKIPYGFPIRTSGNTEMINENALYFAISDDIISHLNERFNIGNSEKYVLFLGSHETDELKKTIRYKLNKTNL